MFALPQTMLLIRIETVGLEGSGGREIIHCRRISRIALTVAGDDIQPLIASSKD